MILSVGEGDFVEGDGPGGALERPRFPPFDDIRFLIEEGERALGAG